MADLVVGRVSSSSHPLQVAVRPRGLPATRLLSGLASGDGGGGPIGGLGWRRRRGCWLLLLGELGLLACGLLAMLRRRHHRWEFWGVQSVGYGKELETLVRRGNSVERRESSPEGRGSDGCERES
jgi:hypothetical protein